MKIRISQAMIVDERGPDPKGSQSSRNCNN